MPRYRLRTLLIVLAIGPALLAGVWWGWSEWKQRRADAEERRAQIQLLWQFTE